jgi:hypothetical protein
MKTFKFFVPIISMVLLTSCTQPNSPFFGGNQPPPPPSVLMPVDLTLRQQNFMPILEDTIRRNGLLPVYRGRADMLLEFVMEEGPINIDTHLRLLENSRVLAAGSGRQAGAPLMNRNQVAENSFYRALQQFEPQLASIARSHLMAAGQQVPPRF